MEKVQKCDDIFVDYKKEKKIEDGGNCTAAPQFKVRLSSLDGEIGGFIVGLGSSPIILM